MKISYNYNPGQQEPTGRAGSAQSSSAAESSRVHARDAHPSSADEAGHEAAAEKAADRGTDAVVDRALESAGVALSARNRELVRSLLENTLPIDRNSIRAAMTEAASYSDTPAEVLALMHKNNIPVNSFSVSGFSEFLRAEQLMLSEMSEVIDSFSELLLSYPEGSAEYSALSQIASEILNGGPVSDSSEAGAGSADSMTADDAGALADALSASDGTLAGSMTGAGATEVAGADALSASDGTLAGSMTGAGTTEVAGADALSASDGTLAGSITDAGASSATAGTAAASDTALLSGAQTSHTAGSGSPSDAGQVSGQAGPGSMTAGEGAGMTGVAGTAAASDTAFLSGAQTSHTAGSDSSSGAGQVSGQTEPAGSSQNPANAQSTGISGNLGAASQDIISGAPLTPEGLKEALKNAFALKPDQINREQIRKMYERAESFLNKLKNVKSGDEESGLHGKVRHARNSLRLLKSINSFYPHAEIPIKFEDGRGTAQLYIYPDGHKRTPDPEHMSVLLHLNMPYLGMTDIRMRLDEKQLGLHFFAADRLSDSLLRADSDSLEQKLEDLGYLVKTAFSTGTAPFVNQTAENETDRAARPAVGEPAEEGTPVFSFDRRA